MRLLLTLLAFLAVVLAIFFNTWWLYGLASLVVIGAIAAWGQALWEDRDRTPPRESAGTATRDELAALGIMEIREKSKSDTGGEKKEATSRSDVRTPDKKSPDDDTAPSEQPLTSEKSKTRKSNTTSTASSSMDQDAPEEPEPPSRSTSKSRESQPPRKEEEGPDYSPSSRGEPKRGASRSNGNVSPEPQREPVSDQPVSHDENDRNDVDEELLSIVTPYLESLRSATQAHTATLLVQDELAISYRVQGVSSVGSHLLPVGSQFESKVPLLTANLSRQPASIRLIGSDLDEENLGYYQSIGQGIQEIGIAPVSRPDHPSTFFLLIDTIHAFDWKRAQRLLARYADLLAVILNTYDNPDELSGAQQEDTSERVDREALPSRRQVIAEEMERARSQDREMALAILYLNRAESIASKGEKAVAGAERALHNWLEKTAPNSRIEPFGELTYGVFFDGNVEEAEAWAAKIQKKSEQAPSPLDGGVSIGLSMLRPRHQSPDALRSDATEALREAYTTGTCTILE